MAPALFARAIMEGKTINQFGDGSSSRDYTYIDDIIDGIVKALNQNLDFEIINLGNNHPVNLVKFIKTVEKVTGNKAKIKKLPKQHGDVEKTLADVVKAYNIIGWKPKTRIEEGLNKYVNWVKAAKL